MGGKRQVLFHNFVMHQKEFEVGVGLSSPSIKKPLKLLNFPSTLEHLVQLSLEGTSFADGLLVLKAV